MEEPPKQEKLSAEFFKIISIAERLKRNRKLVMREYEKVKHLPLTSEEESVAAPLKKKRDHHFKKYDKTFDGPNIHRPAEYQNQIKCLVHYMRYEVKYYAKLVEILRKKQESGVFGESSQG